MNVLLRRSNLSWATLLLGTFCGCTPPASPVADVTRSAVPVKTVAVAQAEVERSTTQPASLHAYYETEIRAKVSGYVATLRVDIGDVVEANAELADIAVPEMVKQLEVMAAQVVRREADASSARAGVELSAASIDAVKAQLAQVTAEAQQVSSAVAALEAEFARTSDLVQRQSLEPRLLDEVRKRRDAELANKQAADSAIVSAQANVAVAQARKGSAEAELQTALAEIRIAQSQQAEMQTLMAYATLRAPFAGVVTARHVNPGDLVREGSDVGAGAPLFVISQVNKLRVKVHVPEAEAAFVSRGDDMILTLPSFPGEEFHAAVSRVAQSLDPSTRTMLVEADLENPDGKLLPGMFGEVRLKLGEPAVAAVLPSRAVRYDGGQPYVYIVDENATVTRSDVTIGRDTGATLEILSGLEFGQAVVDAHLKRFTDGEIVQVLDP